MSVLFAIVRRPQLPRDGLDPRVRFKPPLFWTMPASTIVVRPSVGAPARRFTGKFNAFRQAASKGKCFGLAF